MLYPFPVKLIYTVLFAKKLLKSEWITGCFLLIVYREINLYFLYTMTSVFLHDSACVCEFI